MIANADDEYAIRNHRSGSPERRQPQTGGSTTTDRDPCQPVASRCFAGDGNDLTPIARALPVPAAVRLRRQHRLPVFPPFLCGFRAATPTIVRAEGTTERVGDISIVCTGGIATRPGDPIPAVNIRIFFNITVTSRLLTSAGPDLFPKPCCLSMSRTHRPCAFAVTETPTKSQRIPGSAPCSALRISTPTPVPTPIPASAPTTAPMPFKAGRFWPTRFNLQSSTRPADSNNIFFVRAASNHPHHQSASRPFSIGGSKQSRPETNHDPYLYHWLPWTPPPIARSSARTQSVGH